MVTLDAINSKIAKLQKQAAVIAEKQSSVGLTKIRELMQKHGLTVADIEGFVGKRRGQYAAYNVAYFSLLRLSRSNFRCREPALADRHGTRRRSRPCGFLRA